MFPGCCWVGWLLVLLWVTAGNRITWSGKKEKFARVRAGVVQKKRKHFGNMSQMHLLVKPKNFAVFQADWTWSLIYSLSVSLPPVRWFIGRDWLLTLARLPSLFLNCHIKGWQEDLVKVCLEIKYLVFAIILQTARKVSYDLLNFVNHLLLHMELYKALACGTEGKRTNTSQIKCHWKTIALFQTLSLFPRESNWNSNDNKTKTSFPLFLFTCVEKKQTNKKHYVEMIWDFLWLLI